MLIPAREVRLLPACPEEDNAVDLSVWIPVTFLLGLGALGLMALFILACDRV